MFRSLPLQQPFDSIRVASGIYSATENAEPMGESYLSLSFVSGLSTDLELVMGLRVLAKALFTNESAPVRIALQDARIGKDISAWVDDLKQNVFHIHIKNANPDEAQIFKKIVFETLNDVVKNGLDKAAISGVINRMEFGLREGNTPQKGLSYNGQALSSWFWTDDPFRGLEYEKPLAALKRNISNGYLETLISKYFLNNPHALLFTLNPQAGLEARNDSIVIKDLADYKQKLTPDEVTALVTQTNKLVEYQKSEDSPEALSSIPLLKLSDIKPEADWYEISKPRFTRVPYLHYSTFTNNISYIRFFFDLRVLKEEQLPHAKLLSVLLGSISTANYTFGELDNALDTHLGGFNTYLATYLEDQDDDKLVPKFVLGAKVLTPAVDQVFDLSAEILIKSLLDDVDRLKDVLTRHHSRLSARLKRDGLGYARTRLFSYSTKAGMFNEVTGGLQYYQFISDLVESFDQNHDELIFKLKDVSRTLFTRKNLLTSVTCSDGALSPFKKELRRFTKRLPREKVIYINWQLEPTGQNEGLMAASKVNYVLQGADFKDLGYEWGGEIMVLNQIISREWLKNQVRVIGGAYGGFASFTPSGQVYFGSYRDPNLSETLENYAGTPDFLNSLELSEDELTRFIIGTISRMDRPLTSSQKGNIAVTNYFTKANQAELQAERDAVLSTSLDDVKRYEKMVSEILNNSKICVYGNEEALKKNKTLFSKLIPLD